MRLSQIHQFVAAVEKGSLRAAARSLGVSQPAITKSVRQLEEELRVQLLQRNARGTATTRAGKLFLARARVVQAELRRAEEDLVALRGGAAGAVAFGIAPAACMRIVPEAMQQFRRRYPRADVRIVEGVNTALLPLVRDAVIDFSVGQKLAGKPEAPMQFRPLFRSPLAVIARKGHPLREARSLRALADCPWLMFYQPGTGAMLELAYSALGLPLPRDIVHCESYAVALALVSKTDTLGLLMPQMIDEAYAERHLERIAVAEPIPAPTIGMYSRSDAPLTAAAAAMAQAIGATARRLARGG